jgi:phage/plasmid-like protein (TIGR03299 family)
MMSVGEKPWHGLGKVVTGLQTSKEAIIAAGLDWQVKKYPNQYTIKEGRKSILMNGKGFQVIREDNKESIGDVGARWVPQQNREGFEFMDSVIGRKAAVYETAGALGRGEKVWMMAKVGGLITLGGDDVVDKYFLIANAHDGTKAIKFAVTTVRVVCANTLHLALTEAEKGEKIFSIRHTANAADKVQRVIDYLDVATKKFEDFADLAKVMTKVKMNTAKFDEFLGLVGIDTDAEGGKKESTYKDLVEAFESSPGSKLVTAKGTLWGALNAVTYFTNHTRPTRVTKSSGIKTEAESRLNSVWFGSGNALNQKALAVATEMVSK